MRGFWAKFPLNESLPLGISLTYAVLSGLWVVFSDRILNAFLFEPNDLTVAQTLKGWAFVMATACLLYLLLRQVFKLIQHNEARFRRIYEGISSGVLILTPQGQIIHANASACRMLGLSLKQLQGRSARDPEWKATRADGSPFLPADRPSSPAAGSEMSAACREDQAEEQLIQVVLPSREKRWLLAHTDQIFDPVSNQLEEIVTTLSDVTDREFQAQHDTLTGLPNRLLFKDRLNQALAFAHRKQLPLGVLCLDIDRFSLINDTLGYAAGDFLLQVAAQRLKDSLREGDTIARQGADEFLIILPELTQGEDAAIVARKLMEVLSKPFILEQQEVFITVSMGISLYPTDGEDADTLIKHADAAMYHAKQQGRSSYQFFEIGLNASASERLALEHDLRKALERGELAAYYQPLVDLRSGKIIGMEALVRWHHPTRGLIAPDQFIPLAEDTGLILPLGEWILSQACQQNQAWLESGYPPQRVAVNLSARQFRQPDLVAKITAILDATKLNPGLLELEITESIAMQNTEYTATILNQLKQMGIRIAIDDFGTGFSSLSYLKRFPVDTLKIDRSFVGDICCDPQGEEIVTDIIQLAQNLGLTVVAEGVENMEQLVFLQEHHCHEIQGYLVSKPIPAGEFERLIGQKRPIAV